MKKAHEPSSDVKGIDVPDITIGCQLYKDILEVDFPTTIG